MLEGGFLKDEDFIACISEFEQDRTMEFPLGLIFIGFKTNYLIS